MWQTRWGNYQVRANYWVDLLDRWVNSITQLNASWWDLVRSVLKQQLEVSVSQWEEQLRLLCDLTTCKRERWVSMTWHMTEVTGGVLKYLSTLSETHRLWSMLKLAGSDSKRCALLNTSWQQYTSFKEDLDKALHPSLTHNLMFGVHWDHREPRYIYEDRLFDSPSSSR